MTKRLTAEQISEIDERDIDLLADEALTLMRERDDAKAHMKDAYKVFYEVREQRDAARKALRKYGGHTPRDCGAAHWTVPCVCGWEEVRKGLGDE